MSDARLLGGTAASLYWRIALGLFAFLALMLAAQGALFLWITRPHRRLDARALAAPRWPCWSRRTSARR